MLPKQTEYKVGMYMRLSKDDERSGESLSIENQRKILTEYITQQGWTLYDEYVDDGISGTTFDRPGVQRLLDDAKTGRINLILCKDLSRFGRNYIQVGQYTDYIFPMYNIRFIALTDNVDTANSASSEIWMGRRSTVMPISSAICIRLLLVMLGRIEEDAGVTYLPSLVMARKLLVPNSSTNSLVLGSRKSGTGQ